jgi:hypothetical protein
MKKLLTLAFALLLLMTLSVIALAQERSERDERAAINVDPSMQVQPQTLLPCCDCLGKVTTLNLNTGQGSPIDPIWKVNGNVAYTSAPYPGWLIPTTAPLFPAKWIKPVPNPNFNVPAVDYKYTVKFSTPKCTIPADIQLEVYFAADNSAKVLLDNNPIGTTLCQGNCFRAPQAPVHFTSAVSTNTSHTLDFVVHNDGGPSGLIVNAQLRRICARGNPGPTRDQMEPNN